jgi:outer membrane protein TolC
MRGLTITVLWLWACAVHAQVQPVLAPTPLAALVDRAWSIARGAERSVARGAQIDARALAARAPFAGAPVVGLGVRSDLPEWVRLPGTETSALRGQAEVEPGIAVPLWLPGQRDARQQVLIQERLGLAADERLRRLELAGQVREAAWAVVMARGQWQVQAARERAAQALEADVRRRVDAGDLAPADLMMARTDRLTAVAARAEAQAEVELARARLLQLCGADVPNDLAEPLVEESRAGEHPRMLAAREAQALARAALAEARASRRDPPMLSASARFDREVDVGNWRNTFRLGLSIPLDTEARNAPRLAAAAAQALEAELAVEQVQRELDTARAQARVALELARTGLATHLERAEVAAAAAAALERAFFAGERSLPEVLRLRSLATEAAAAAALAHDRVGREMARFNQTLGVEP